MNDNQPESPVRSGLSRRRGPRRGGIIRDGKAMLAQYRETLAGIEQQSGVPRGILLAIWGMESDSAATPANSTCSRAGDTGLIRGARRLCRAEFSRAEDMQEQHYACRHECRPGRGLSARPSSRPPLS